MRIAIVLGLFPVLSETFIINHINALLDSGNKVDIYAYNKGSINIIHESLIQHDLLNKVIYKETMPKSKYMRFCKFYKLILKNRSTININLFLKSLNFLKYGKKALSLLLFYQSYWFQKKDNYDIVHVHFGPVAFDITHLKEKGFLGQSKLVVTLHGYDVNSKYLNKYKLEYSKLFTQTDLILVNTSYTHNLLTSVFPTIKNINILPVGLDTNFFSPNNLEKSEVFNIIFCGRLVRCKNPVSSIHIFKKLVDRNIENVKLEIIGDGYLKEDLEAIIRECQLQEKVILRGSLSQSKIKQAMNNSSLLLMPGIYDVDTDSTETQGLVIQEAQAMKLPVIVSDAGGMKYGILPDESGFVIREGDINGFADAIEWLINNKMISEKMGETGRRFVVKNYDSKVINAKLLNLYNTI